MSKPSKAPTNYTPHYERVRDRIRGAYSKFKQFPAHNQIGLTMSAISLGLGVSNFLTNKDRIDVTKQQAEIDKKSLTALQKIHKALQAPKKPE